MKLTHRKRIILLSVPLLALFAVFLAAAALAAQETETTPMEEKAGDLSDLASRASVVLEDRMAAAPDNRIPTALREQALCVAVFPSVVKAGVVVAGSRGRGLLSCRDASSGEWGAPGVLKLRAGSVGFQAGAQSSRVILLAMNQKAVDALKSGEMELGAGIDIAAGPIGGEAQADTRASILSYTRSKGLFAGVSLEGSKISPAAEMNAEAYGSEATLETILSGTGASPESLQAFRDVLSRYAGIPT